MDLRTFDRFTVAIARPPTRRTALRLLTGGALTGLLGLAETAAKKKQGKKRNNGHQADAKDKKNNGGGKKKKKACPPCKKKKDGKCKANLPFGTSCEGGACDGNGSCLPAASSPPPPPPPPPRQVVTRSFSQPVFVLVPSSAGTSGPADIYPWEIVVSGLTNGTILDVNVFLHGFTHEHPDDVDILLAATHLPGRNALFMTDVGGSTDVNNINLTLDDAAPGSLPDDGPLVSGTFKPTNLAPSDSFPAPAPAPTGNSQLSTFNGQNPNGTWRLWVVDDSTGDIGVIGGWTLQITAEVDA